MHQRDAMLLRWAGVAEVNDGELAVVDDDIARMQIAVGQALAVQVVDGVGQAIEGIERLRHGKRLCQFVKGVSISPNRCRVEAVAFVLRGRLSLIEPRHGKCLDMASNLRMPKVGQQAATRHQLFSTCGTDRANLFKRNGHVTGGRRVLSTENRSLPAGEPLRVYDSVSMAIGSGPGQPEGRRSCLSHASITSSRLSSYKRMGTPARSKASQTVVISSRANEREMPNKSATC